MPQHGPGTSPVVTEATSEQDQKSRSITMAWSFAMRSLEAPAGDHQRDGPERGDDGCDREDDEHVAGRDQGPSAAPTRKPTFTGT